MLCLKEYVYWQDISLDFLKTLLFILLYSLPAFLSFFFTVMIAWGADVSSSHKEYQNILKDYQQNLVICSCIGVEITWNFV